MSYTKAIGIGFGVLALGAAVSLVYSSTVNQQLSRFGLYPEKVTLGERRKVLRLANEDTAATISILSGSVSDI